jgi:dienelactone hydrolase
LVCNGASDPFISGESEVAFTRAMDSIDADYLYISYEDAKHSFTSPAADSLGRKFDLPLEYQKKADEASWKELQKFLEDTFE